MLRFFLLLFLSVHYYLLYLFLYSFVTIVYLIFFSVAFATRPTNRRRRLAAALRCFCLLCCGCCYFSAAVQFALLPREHFFGFTAASASFHCAALYNTLIQREPIFNLTFFVAVLNFRPHAFTLTFVCGGGTHRVAYTAAAAVLPNGSNTGRCCAAHNLRKFEINKGGTWRRQSMEQQQQYQVENSCKIKQKIITKWNKHFYVTISISISLALQPMSYCILCFPLDFRCLLVFFWLTFVRLFTQVHTYSDSSSSTHTTLKTHTHVHKGRRAWIPKFLAASRERQRNGSARAPEREGGGRRESSRVGERKRVSASGAQSRFISTVFELRRCRRRCLLLLAAACVCLCLYLCYCC